MSAPTMTGAIDDPNLPNEEAVETDTWFINDEPTADWALGRIADLEREIAVNKLLAAEAISRIESRTEGLNARVQRSVDFFKNRIVTFAQTHRHTLLGGGKKKTRDLLHGSISWRKSGGGLEVLDRAKLLDWAREQPAELGFVRIREEPAIDEVKKVFKTTGEIPPGCDVKPETEEIIVKAELGEKHGEH